MTKQFKVKRSKLSMAFVLSLVIFMLVASGCGTKTEAPQAAAPAAEPTTATPTPPAPPKNDFPSKDIEVVYHSSAGSGGDIFLRTMGKAVEPAMGKAWVVNNMPGASGANAWNYVAKANPDGYILLGVSSTLITAPILNKMPVSYKDFEPVAMMFNDPMVLFVPGDSPLKSIADLVKAAKAAPGKLKWAGGTPGELGFVAGNELMKAAGFDMTLVPFEGGGDAAVTVLGGHLDGGIGEYAEIASNVEAGKLRIIGSFNKMPLNPGIETVAEAGYPQVKVEKLRGVVAPKGTPVEVIDKLVEFLKKSLDDPTFKKYYETNNLIVNFKSKDDFRAAMDEQDKQIRAAIAN